MHVKRDTKQVVPFLPFGTAVQNTCMQDSDYPDQHIIITMMIFTIEIRFAELDTCYMINTVEVTNMTDNGANNSGAKYDNAENQI